MKIINKLTILFVLLFVCAFSVYAADYSTPEGEGALITDVVVSTIAPQPYTGKAITPAVTLTWNGVTLTEGTDYTLTYSNNIKIGTATVTITGKGNYTGTKTVNFKILRNIAATTVSGVVNKTYTGSRQGQKLTVKYGKTTLKAGTHYTASYTNNTNAGTATITITGKGVWAGTKTVTFKINRRSITGLKFSKVNNYYYTGKSISPNVTIKYGTRTLVKNTDYKVTYTRNVNVGTATITVTGLGNYYGTKKITFKINKRPITYATITGLAGKTYTGSRIGQNLTLVYNGIILKAGTHYTLSYTNNINAGTATVTITGKGNFSGSKKLSFKIYKRNVSTLTITSGTATTYAGSARTPAVTVKQGTKVLTKNTHYTVAYKNNLNVGTATITVTGKGNYTGTKTLTFEIKPRAISTVTISGLANKVYTGNRIGQSLKLTLGKVTLKAGTDYTLVYANNTEVGKATVTVTGKGNYTGTKELTFNINKRNISSLTYNKVSNYVYSGKAITPAIAVKYGTKVLVQDTDYTVAYKNNTNVGTATITITGRGSYTGTKTITFKINRRSIATATITGLAAKEYTGKAITQALTLTYNDITLKAGTHYTIAYTNNKNVGKATVTITGKGNFTGTKTLTFNINPQVPTVKSAVATGKNIKVTWNKVANATGYVLYMSKDGAAYSKIATITKNSTVTYTAQKLEAGEYSFKVRAYKTVSKVNYYSGYSEAKAATITSVPVPTIKFGEKVTGPDMSVQYTILMENTSELDGVEVYYATGANGEYKLHRSYSKADFTSYDIAVEIPKNAHYYFKVRGYKEVNGTKVYGAYSNVLDFNNEVKEGPVTYILGEDIEVGLYKVTPIDSTKTVALTEYIPPEVYEELPPGAGFGVEIIEMHKGYVEITNDYEGIVVENATLEKITLEDIPTNIKTSVSNGMYVVGKDITAGMYKVTSSAVAEIKTMDSAVLWDWSNLEQLQSGYIQITEETKFVNVLNGTITRVDMDEIPTDIKTTVSNGMYLVGKDIAPGTYKVTMTEKVSDYYFNVGIYWQGQYSLEMGSAMMERGYIEIPQNGYAVNLIGVTIEKITEIPTDIKTTISEDGTYIVGKDIAPGVYKATATVTQATDESMEIIRMSGITLNYEDDIAYGYSAYDYVEIKDTDKAVYIQNYKLEKVDLDNMPVNIKTTVSDGAYIVGKDIAPGTYKVQGNKQGLGVVEKANAIDLSYESYTGELYGDGYIEVAETDMVVRVQDATITKINLEDIETNIKTTVAGDGMYLVGKDIAPGTYKVTPYGDNNYYGSVELVDSLDGHYNSQINYWYVKYGFIEVDSECVAVAIEGVQLEKIVVEDMPVNIKDTLSDGAYIVGKDIAPGTYKVQGTGKSYCKIDIYLNANEIKNNTSLKTGYIEVTEEDFAISVTKGTITKIDIDDIATNIKETVSDGVYLVGKDIKPGMYKIVATKASSEGNVDVYDSINMMEMSESYYYDRGYVEISEEAVVVQVINATLTKVDIDNIPVDIKETFTSEHKSMYLVGKDIALGVYKLTGEGSWSSANTYKSLDRQEFGNSCYGKSGYITVEDTDVVVELYAGTLTKIDPDNLPTPNIKESVTEGSYLVGVDIAPGMYLIESSYDGGSMYVSTYSEITTNYEFQTNSVYTSRGFIEIKDTDALVTVNNSGKITKVNIDELPVNIKTEISHENYTSGTYIVGKDIEPGIYEITGTYNPDWYESYVYRHSSVTGETQLGAAYIENENGMAYIEVLPTDTAIYIYNASIRKITFDDIPVDMKDTVSDGSYIVGKDLAYGTYKYTLNEGAESSWIETYSSLNTIYENKINEYNGNYGYFELTEDEKTIIISGVTITKVDLNEMPEDIKTSVTTGTYIVGKDIAPGTYKATGIDGSWAYVARLSSIDKDDIIEEYYVEEVYIEIKDTDVAVYVGGWTLLEKVDSIPETTSEEETVVEQNNTIEQEVEPVEETTTIVEEPQQTEVSIYKEVDIYTED